MFLLEEFSHYKKWSLGRMQGFFRRDILGSTLECFLERNWYTSMVEKNKRRCTLSGFLED